MTSRIGRFWWPLLGGVVLGVLPCVAATAWAQESKSAPLAKELTKLLDDRKLESFAAKDPQAPDQFIGALYFPGSMLLVVSAKYAAPPILEERLTKEEYRDVYVDLQSASVAQTKIFVQDQQADGLKVRQSDAQPLDGYESENRPLSFDDDWRRRQKMSEEDFARSFAAADERYVQMLSVLIEALKKSS